MLSYAVSVLFVSSLLSPSWRFLFCNSRLPRTLHRSPSQPCGFPLGLAFLPPDTGPGFFGKSVVLAESEQGSPGRNSSAPVPAPKDAPGFQAVALLQHDLGQAAQKSVQLGDFLRGWGGGRTKSEGGTTRDGRGTLWCGQPWDPRKPRGPSLALIPSSLTQSYQVHTLLGSAQPGRTLRAWSLNVPSAASERPSAPEPQKATVPAARRSWRRSTSW